MKFTLLFLVIISAISAAEWNSVMVPDITRHDLEAFSEEGYDIEAVFGDRVRLYVTPEQETLLENMGYRVFREDSRDALVAYPTFDEINSSLNAVVSAHPSIARIQQIGTSVDGRAINAVIVSDNVNQDEAEPEIRITGNIHGDEKSSAMSVLNFLEVLTDNYGTSDMCTYVVNNSELWVITVVNPDGYVAHQRYNSNGIDLNRNLSYMGPGSGGGSTAFSEPETQALRDLTMQNWPDQENFINPFATGLSFHSGAECVNCVWNYSVSATIPDLDFVTAQGTAYAQAPSIVAYYGSYDLWIPGGSWYETNGDVNDWSYGECGTVDHTIEVSDIKSPEDWPGVAEANYMPMLEFCVTSTYGIYGTVEDASGNPLDAVINISGADGTDSSPLMFCRSDVIDGGYSKGLVPGTYNVTATVDGMGSLSQDNIVVAAEEMVPVNFVFSTGIEGSTNEGLFIEISVGPNPVTGNCTISLPDMGVEGSLEIYDICGRAVYEKNIESGVVNYSFDAGSELPSGVYQVRYTSRGLSASTRMVVTD